MRQQVHLVLLKKFLIAILNFDEKDLLFLHEQVSKFLTQPQS